MGIFTLRFPSVPVESPLISSTIFATRWASDNLEDGKITFTLSFSNCFHFKAGGFPPNLCAMVWGEEIIRQLRTIRVSLNFKV
jgi:hypothetical protein